MAETTTAQQKQLSLSLLVRMIQIPSLIQKNSKFLIVRI